MFIKHFDILMQFEKIMPNKAEKLRQESKMSKSLACRTGSTTADISISVSKDGEITKKKVVGGTINGD